jgi:transketolase
MLIYSLLHLAGYDLSIDELKNFRQLHSKTPGHPEYGYAPGIETTTGPLGQGITNAVGMALAEKVLAAQFNRDAHNIVDHHTYTFLGDGCLMEGISHEACSLAGTLGLGKLIAFYDDNGISIDGEVAGGHGVPAWFTDDTASVSTAYHWQVIGPIDGHDSAAIQAAIAQAKAETEKPSLIICKTIIGFGSPNKQGKEECHGAPLGAEEIALARKQLNWPHAPFEIPAEIGGAWNARNKGAAVEKMWQEKFAAYAKAYPQEAAEFERRMKGELPADFAKQADAYIAACQEKGETIASRKASQNTLGAYGSLLPEFLGGSADLAGSNLTIWKGSDGAVCKGIDAHDASGNYLHYGVREFGMSAMMNGIALHGGFIPYGATFLMFMEYARNAVRMAALMKQRVLFVYTHDSIGLGEDGPTHQPVEQLTALRSTPHLHTWRPCDTVESAASWKAALEYQHGPTALIFSRQNLPHQARSAQQVADIARGGYILKDSVGTPKTILIATGSEVDLAMQAAAQLGDGVRVVSMPCAEVFCAQNAEYREAVLPSAVRARVAIEAAHPDYWHKFVGLDGRIIGVHRFGESAPAGALFKEYGFTVEHVVAVAKKLY